jgi:hydrogenase maturation protease
MSRRRIVIGIGNPERGDDAAGRQVARLLHGKLPDGIELAEQDGEATALLAGLDGAASAILVDACASGAPAGTVRRFDLSAAALPHGAFGVSSHGLGLAEAVGLARALGQLPARCILYAIEGESFAIGASLSPSVGIAVADVAQRIHAELIGDAEQGAASACTKPA